MLVWFLFNCYDLEKYLLAMPGLVYATSSASVANMENSLYDN
jgi:hypothetical protein